MLSSSNLQRVLEVSPAPSHPWVQGLAGLHLSRLDFLEGVPQRSFSLSELDSLVHQEGPVGFCKLSRRGSQLRRRASVSGPHRLPFLPFPVNSNRTSPRLHHLNSSSLDFSIPHRAGSEDRALDHSQLGSFHNPLASQRTRRHLSYRK